VPKGRRPRPAPPLVACAPPPVTSAALPPRRSYTPTSADCPSSCGSVSSMNSTSHTTARMPTAPATTSGGGALQSRREGAPAAARAPGHCSKCGRTRSQSGQARATCTLPRMAPTQIVADHSSYAVVSSNGSPKMQSSQAGQHVCATRATSCWRASARRQAAGRRQPTARHHGSRRRPPVAGQALQAQLSVPKARGPLRVQRPQHGEESRLPEGLSPPCPAALR